MWICHLISVYCTFMMPLKWHFFLSFWDDKLNRTELSQVLRLRSLAGLTVRNELLLHVCPGSNSLNLHDFTDSPSPQRRCLNRASYLKLNSQCKLFPTVEQQNLMLLLSLKTGSGFDQSTLTWLSVVHLVGPVFFTERCPVGFVLTEWEEWSHWKATAPITHSPCSLNVKLLCITQSAMAFSEY